VPAHKFNDLMIKGKLHQFISNQVDTSSINYEGDRVAKSGLQRLGSAVMNITGAISIPNHTHLEVTKDNHSMPKLTYLGPW